MPVRGLVQHLACSKCPVHVDHMCVCWHVSVSVTAHVLACVCACECIPVHVSDDVHITAVGVPGHICLARHL